MCNLNNVTADNENNEKSQDNSPSYPSAQNIDDFVEEMSFKKNFFSAIEDNDTHADNRGE